LSERKVEIVVDKEIRQKLRALKGQDSYSNYLDKLMRVGSKQDE